MANITITLATKGTDDTFNTKELAMPANLIDEVAFKKAIEESAHFFILETLDKKIADLLEVIEDYNAGDDVSFEDKVLAEANLFDAQSLRDEYATETANNRATSCDDTFIIACLDVAKIGVKFNFTFNRAGLAEVAKNYYTFMDTEDAETARLIFKRRAEEIACYYLKTTNADGLYKNITPRINNAILKDVVAILKKSPQWTKKGIKNSAGLSTKDELVVKTIIDVVLANDFEFNGTSKKSRKGYTYTI